MPLKNYEILYHTHGASWDPQVHVCDLIVIPALNDDEARAAFAQQMPGGTIWSIDEEEGSPFILGLFHPVSKHPPLTMLEDGQSRSNDVLGLTSDGRMLVVCLVYRQDGQDALAGEYSWRTASNSKDVSDQVIGWMEIPESMHMHSEVERSEADRIALSNGINKLIDLLNEAKEELITPIVGDDLSEMSAKRLKHLAKVLPLGHHRTAVLVHLRNRVQAERA